MLFDSFLWDVKKGSILQDNVLNCSRREMWILLKYNTEEFGLLLIMVTCFRLSQSHHSLIHKSGKKSYGLNALNQQGRILSACLEF